MKIERLNFKYEDCCWSDKKKKELNFLSYNSSKKNYKINYGVSSSSKGSTLFTSSEEDNTPNIV